MSWVSVFALRTMIGAWLFGRTSRMNEKPSMPPSMRSTSMRSGGLRWTSSKAASALGASTTSYPSSSMARLRAVNAVVVLEDQELQRHRGNPYSGTWGSVRSS